MRKFSVFLIRGVVMCLMAAGLMSAMTSPAAAEVVCRESALLGNFDSNKDGVVSPDEIRAADPNNTRLQEIAAELEARGVTGIQYANCPAATNVPATNVPATNVPATNVPATNVPATNVPATNVPATNVPATQVPTTVQCQTIIDGQIDQQDCVVTITGDGQCQVVLESGEIQQNIVCSPEGCPQQLIDEDGNIFQFQCGDAQPTATATATPVTPTATATPVTPTATATPVTPTATATPVTPGATQTPVTPVPSTGGEGTSGDTAEELEVLVVSLPATGQGASSETASHANVLLLGTIGLAAVGAMAAWRLRREA